MTLEEDHLVDAESLQTARKRLVALEDIFFKDEGAVPPWVVAARRAVEHERSRRDDDAR
jgi:hypothetical protein